MQKALKIRGSLPPKLGNDLSAPPKLNRRVEYDSLKRPDVTAGSAADAGGGQ